MASLIAVVTAAVVVPLWFAAAHGSGFAFLGKRVAPVTLEADLSRRQLYVRRGGEVIETYGIAVGRAGHPTPEGSYAIHLIVWNPGWVPPDRAWAAGKKRREPGDPANPMQGVKIYFKAPTYFIHGTNDPESIGSAASHGCIRMATEDVQQLAQNLMEYTGAGESEAWFRAARSNSTGTRYVTLPLSIPFVIRR